MRTHWIIMVVAAFVVAFGVPATAGMMGQMPPAGQAAGVGSGSMSGMMDHEMRGPAGHRMGGHEGPLITMMLRHNQDLGLSPEQEKQLRALRTEFAKESVRRNAEIRVLQIDVDALLEQDRWDLAQIEPKVKQIATLEGELRAARIKTLAEGRAMLTAQQLEKLKQLGHYMPSMGGPGGMGHGMRGPGGPGGPPAQPNTH